MLSTLIIDFYKSLMFFNSHYGHKSISLTKKKGVHPLSSSLILGSKNNCPIIDPTQTLKAFIKSLYILQVFSKRFNNLKSSSIKKQKIEIENRFFIKDQKEKSEKTKIKNGSYLKKIRIPNTINKALQETNLLSSFFTTLALNPFLFGEKKAESSISSTLPLRGVKDFGSLIRREKQVSKRSCKFVRSNPSNLLLNQKISAVDRNYLLKREEEMFLKSNLNLLVVSTNPDFSTLIRNLFQSTSLKGCSLAYCNEKWVGGLLTNWKQVSKSIELFGRFSNKFDDFLNKNRVYSPRFKKLHRDFQGFLFKRNDLEADLSNSNSKENRIESGFPFAPLLCLRQLTNQRDSVSLGLCPKDLSRQEYTNKGESKLQISRYTKNNRFFSNSKTKTTFFPSTKDKSHLFKLPFKRKPDLIILINSNDNKDLIQEANNLNIPIIGIINSNTKPLGVTYPVPGNSNSIHFVYFFLKWVIRVLNNPDLLPLKEFK